MNLLNKITGTAGRVRNAFLIAGGLLLLLFGVSRVPHFGSSGASATHATNDMDIGVAHAEAGDSAGSGGDSGGSGGDSGGSGGGSSSGG